MFCDRYISDNTYVLANENLRAVFDPMTLELISLTDRSGREYISAPAGYFSMITENARFGMTAWRVGERMNETNLNVPAIPTFTNTLAPVLPTDRAT